MADVAVIGGGISGIACAKQLAERGITVDVFDRGHRLGGRLACQTLRDTGTSWDGRVVDVGASYFTASDPQFRALVDDWRRRGVAREWTDTLHVEAGDGALVPKVGPMRYSAPRGMRSLVEDLAEQLPEDRVTLHHPVDVERVEVLDDAVAVNGVRYEAAALCGPDPQMSTLMSREPQPPVLWEPAMALTAVYDERYWGDLDGVFVNDDPVLTFIADDGRRRGDSAPVLVAHSSPVLAALHLAEPTGAAPAMLASLTRAMDIPLPAWFSVKRWTFARPASGRPEPCGIDGRVGWAGDAWAGGPRTQSAWVSGTTLGRALLD